MKYIRDYNTWNVLSSRIIDNACGGTPATPLTCVAQCKIPMGTLIINFGCPITSSSSSTSSSTSSFETRRIYSDGMKKRQNGQCENEVCRVPGCHGNRKAVPQLTERERSVQSNYLVEMRTEPQRTVLRMDSARTKCAEYLVATGTEKQCRSVQLQSENEMCRVITWLR